MAKNFAPHAEKAERLFSQPAPDRDAIRELILLACKNMIMLLTQEDTVNLEQIYFTRAALSHVGLSIGP
ncbi:HTH-type transcriptional regulator ybiH [Salmonella enterica subsp. enterica]|uniref:HTH-type transcriptional regulator ybiH n=1 Tax=Salmonella enterica I TaxID=59201 RepID=A0A447U6M1_SALET|nr:HTH-type transcriptional regulator ybiH [Salmonella enterica subsp. enterica]